ncbi:MAG TPA: hypothetical protein VEA69_14850 [Tepidisphaeraceae bacterium]|nr:hypothetical protein [Tepidisphaeraceae bacterium]
MARVRSATVQDLLRLDAMGRHLGVGARHPDPFFARDVIAASVGRVAPLLNEMLPCTGEEMAEALGRHLCVTFEEVRGPGDIDALEDRYLRGKREIGFGQLRRELAAPNVDALLFQRLRAEEHDPDRWVAVLNLQRTESRGYWNRFHELAHRIAEPPQGVLPFARHGFDASNPLESLIDLVAAELAFYPPAVRPKIAMLWRHRRLDFGVVDAFHAAYAPSASLLATAKAAVRFWPRPAVLLTAEVRGRKRDPSADRALRITVTARNDAARAAGLTFIPNMRVPAGSPIAEAFGSGEVVDAEEVLDRWTTSGGTRLSPIGVHTAARPMGPVVYATVTI